MARATFRIVLACGGLLLGATAASVHAQLTRVEGFSEIPGGAFHNIVNPSACSVHFREDIPIEVGGRTITWSYYCEVRADHRYPMGCANYSPSSWNTWRVPPNQAIDPGDFIADYMVPEDGNGDVIINFSEPLTAYGSTSILGPFANSSRPNNRDTFVVYDGLNGTGNILATVTTADIVHLQLRLDFAGVVATAPMIRSVRYINEFPSLTIDGIAVAIGAPCQAPAVTAQPQDLTLCAPAGGSLSVSATGTGLAFQWRRNGVELSESGSFAGVNTANLTLANTDNAGAGAYDCVVSNSCGSATSNAATVVVNSADFDGDGDLGTDSDIDAYFACLSGACCTGCGSADFNGDGDLGTDDDIEAFFRVLAGGSC